VYIDSNDAGTDDHGIVEQWNSGVDTELFHPELACQQMRKHLSGGYPPCYFMWVVFPQKRN